MSAHGIATFISLTQGRKRKMSALCFATIFILIQGIKSLEEDKQIAVARFQTDGLFSKEATLRYAPNFDRDLKDLTLCLRVRVTRVRGMESVFLDYQTQEEDGLLKMYFKHHLGKFSLEICRLESLESECLSVDLVGIVEPMKWIHVCAAFRATLSEYEDSVRVTGTAYLDGKVAQTVETDYLREDFQELPANGTLILGLNQDNRGGSGDFDEDEAFSGELSQVQLFDRVLDAQTILKMAECKVDERGDQVAWDMDLWEVTNVDVVYSNLSWLCEGDPLLRQVVVAEQVSHESMTRACRNLGGQMPAPEGQQEREVVHKQFLTTLEALNLGTDNNCLLSGKSAFVLGQKVRRRVGNHTTAHAWQTPTAASASIWSHNQNVGNGVVVVNSTARSVEKCLYSRGAKHVQTHDCHVKKACGFCLLDSSPGGNIIKLKGMCPKHVSKEEDSFDQDFYIYGQVAGRPHFMGLRHSHIYFDRSTEKWTLQSLSDPGKNLTMTHSGLLPMGRNAWEPDICNPRSNSPFELTFSRCFPNKFTCNDGTCIDLKLRCNTEIDCLDESDELNCSYISLDKSYASELMPRDSRSRGPLNVYINVSILALPSIDTVKLKLSVDFFLNLRWRDLRLGLRDLTDVNLLNVLGQQDVESIWKPDLVFTNAIGSYQTVYDDQVTAIVMKESNKTHEDFSKATEGMLFDPRENSISMSREYFVDYTCQYDLKYYPFDAQVCKMVFAVMGKTDDYILLQKDGIGVEFLDGRTLVEYEIQKETLEIKTVDRVSVAEVKIVFRRRMEYHLYNTLTQTLILVLVGYMSYYFNLDDFNARIMVTLTTMLVIATTTAAIQLDLPKTANFKMIDVWLFFASNVLVITMVFHTYLSCIVDKAKRQIEGRDWGSHSIFRRATRDQNRTKVELRNGNGTTGPSVMVNGIDGLDAAGERLTDGNGLTATPAQQVIFVTPAISPEQQQQLQQNHVHLRHMPEVESAPVSSATNANRARAADLLSRAARFNDLAKLVYLAVVIGFNVAFWVAAVREHTRPPEEYLKEK